jgi:hypothetical protein
MNVMRIRGFSETLKLGRAGGAQRLDDFRSRIWTRAFERAHASVSGSPGSASSESCIDPCIVGITVCQREGVLARMEFKNSNTWWRKC